VLPDDGAVEQYDGATRQRRRVKECPALLGAGQHAFPVQPVQRRHQRRVGDAGELRLQVADARRRVAGPQGVEYPDFKRPEGRFELLRGAVLSAHEGVRLYDQPEWSVEPINR